MRPQEKEDYENCVRALPEIERQLSRQMRAPSLRTHVGNSLRALFGLRAKRPAPVDGLPEPVRLADVKSFYAGMFHPNKQAIDSVSGKFCDLLQRRPEWLDFKHRAEAMGVTPRVCIMKRSEWAGPLHGYVESSVAYVRFEKCAAAAVVPARTPALRV